MYVRDFRASVLACKHYKINTSVIKLFPVRGKHFYRSNALIFNN